MRQHQGCCCALQDRLFYYLAFGFDAVSRDKITSYAYLSA
jgi:hypothetical protein